MALRLSVTGCVSMLGIVSVATGCSGVAPGQTSLARMGLSGNALAKQLAASVPADAKKDPAAAVAAAQQVLAKASPEDVKALAAVAQAAVTKDLPADAAKVAEAPKADAVVPAAEAPQAVAPEAAKEAVDVAKATPEAAPALGFMLGGLLDAVVPSEAEDDAAKVLFHDGFDEGLASWVSRGLGQAAALATPDQLVLASASKARKSLWIKTRTEIDLAASAEPRLRLDFKGEPVALKAVWETDNGAFPEEIMLTAVGPEAKDAAPEFDLSALRGRPGHLVLVAKSTKGEAAPILDGVTIYDAFTTASR